VSGTLPMVTGMTASGATGSFTAKENTPGQTGMCWCQCYKTFFFINYEWDR
jgi:hypothetical protein